MAIMKVTAQDFNLFKQFYFMGKLILNIHASCDGGVKYFISVTMHLFVYAFI